MIAKLTGYIVECFEGHINTLTESNCSISANTYECGLCGTHGEIELSIYINCSTCNVSLNDIKLSSW